VDIVENIFGRKQLGALVFVVFAVCVFIQACSPSPNEGEPGPDLQETPTSRPTSTTVPAPSPTPEPHLVFLITPPGANPEAASEVERVLDELTAVSGMRLESQSELTQNSIPDDTYLVVVLAPDPGVVEIAAARPEINFLAVGIPGISAGGNINLVGGEGDRPDRQGFIAGYLAAVVTKDWRVGTIGSSISTPGQAARDGFLNGVIFFCGLCRPAFPPFSQYPQFYDVGINAGEDELKAAADYLIAQGIETIYIAPGFNNTTLFEYLVESEVNIIGSVSPDDRFLNNWITTVGLDFSSAIKLIWPRILNGETGISIDIPIILSERNQTLFSPGRQQLVERILADLLIGYIGTGVDPITIETP